MSRDINSGKALFDTRKKAIALAVGVIAAAVLAVLFFMTVERAASLLWPDCILRTVTGLRCVLCGGTRCAREIIGGDFAKALYYNPFVVICGIFAAYLYIRLIISVFAKEYRTLRIGKGCMWAVLIGAVLFTAVRNMDFYQSVFY